MDINTPPANQPTPPQRGMEPPPLLSSATPPGTPTLRREPPRRRGRGWMIVALVLLCLLGASMLWNAGHYMRGFMKGRLVTMHHQAGPRLEEVYVEEDETSNKILVIPVEGIIMSDAFDPRGF